MEAVADEIVAEQDGGFVAAQVVDGRPLAAQLGFVENVVVNERGHVNHLDDGAEDDMGVVEFAAGFAGEQDKRGAEHFPAKARDVLDELVDAGEVAGQFFVESTLDGFKFAANTLI
jgi:hypothetical protein